jgi:serine phosphatase RsbU (regulator of sigma subunit)/FixJ family two-component response regulator/anti-sigma regulatory factor (Ser/Thr protein kinase)
MNVPRVLIVDDDPGLLQALPETLRLKLGDVVVDTSDSASRALTQIATTDYDAIVTDIKMPGMDGLGLLAQIHSLRPDTPTLLITGHGQRDLALQALRGGAYDFIQKPIDREYFIASLQRAIQMRQLKRRVEEQRAVLAAHATQLEDTVQERTHELREAVDRVQALTEVATAIHAARGVGEVMRSIAEAARRLSGAQLALAGVFRSRTEVSDGEQWYDVAVAPREAAAHLPEASRAAFFAPVLKHQGSYGANDLPVQLVAEMTEHSLQIASYLAVPIHARTGQMLGAIVLGHSQRHEVEGVQEQIEGLARQATIALENALLYERERGIAETLQRSLLPERLPDIPGTMMAARYLPGVPEAIGGDWYDVLELDSGEVGLVMGDVAGRGVWAATVMGQLRNALRAYALGNVQPAAIGELLNRFIDPGAMATLLYLVFDPYRGVARYVNFGHLPPLVITPNHAANFLGNGGGRPPLGTPLGTPCREETVKITPGSTIFLYTDGLVEVRGKTLDDGLTRLKHAATRESNRELDQLLDRIMADVLEGRTANDDIAMLALRTPLDNPQQLQLRVPALPSSLPRIRSRLRRWLEARNVAEQDTQEVLIAIGEACSNAVMHAYVLADGVIELEAELSDDPVGISMLVRDQGQWRPRRSFNQGHGIAVMRALMDSVNVVPGPRGTTVQMSRRLRGHIDQ